MRKTLILGVLAVGAMFACSPEPRLCEVCQRGIHADVRAAIVLDNGRRVDACCPRCAMHYRATSTEQVLRIEVTDHDRGSLLPLEQAYLVEGSDLTPCIDHHPISDDTHLPMRICYDRCMPSLIAFASEPQARAFIAIHGGNLLPSGSRTTHAVP